MSDSEHEDLVDSEPPAIDPYDVLGLDREATAIQVKSAYRKAALKNHPDKVPQDQKEEAHTAFQSIAFAYAILSDPARRKRYDTTGSTSDSIVDSEGFNWSDYYRAQYHDAVSADAIEKFAKKYKGSDEEKDDLLIAYGECEGDMDQIYERVVLSNVLEDDERFRKMIDQAIEERDVPSFKAYKNETKRKRLARRKAAGAEAQEAEEYAKELGVHEKLFGDGPTKGTAKGKGAKGKKGSEADLAALIQSRQKERSDALFDRLAEKYGATSNKGKKGKKGSAKEDDEPSEEAFQAAAASLAKRKAAAESSRPASRSKKAKRS
ncbi:DnaJ -like protein subfamily C member 9 [Escovopsis weberi]|uniref:DnaJ-like protein subfamily C member 9 n=1 Tax=Escovopsis weberi TaxID=150374 RepID=A0A0N0RTK9_ESCWE|nr:DnaJ -like protein subfamily C member 9 [Escovopsis weberi]